ncbi:uncharacterized protein EAF02_004625 [Botrytis sinoallii]|uniref:uncharacterized protein n=1 Tax=Botrytis sinoallii TaxID=1463999 RepID=UPI0019012BDF|nr:uncharacterized protein EAF02_004625 [Botrytis sinoallii]KAF7884289.1 hypothetical protein EAF02_004625 [Botrytis sinoallii]
MHASFSAVVTTLLAVSVAALPNNGGGNPTHTWGSTSPTGAPTCSGTKYTCESNSLLSLLTCTNILNGVGISIPIILKARDVEEREIEARTSKDDGDYCCTATGLLSLSCLNVANGVVISLPIIL